MSVNARNSAWKFERHVILQQMLEHYKDAYVRHQDPGFIKRHVQQPEATGRNFISFLCCNYWFVKSFAEPILNTTSSFHELAYTTTEWMSTSRSRLTCLDHRGTPVQSDTISRFEDEKKGRMTSSALVLFLSKAINTTDIACSYVIVLLFVYASFTV